MWGIHNDKPQFDFVGDGFIALGWAEIGDLRQVGRDRQAMKAAVASAYPGAKPGAIPVWAGVLLRFAFEMEPGDVVVHPDKADATVSIGRVEGDYFWDRSATGNRHRRTVGWLHTGVPRRAFSKGARYEIGSSVTLFKVRRHAREFMAFFDASRSDPTTGLPGVW